jgi:hypothetical protein
VECFRIPNIDNYWYWRFKNLKTSTAFYAELRLLFCRGVRWSPGIPDERVLAPLEKAASLAGFSLNARRIRAAAKSSCWQSDRELLPQLVYYYPVSRNYA